MHLVHTERSPVYLSELVTATADLASHAGLRFACSKRYKIPRTVRKFGERAFSFAGPRAWNSLPAELQEQKNTTAFKRQLKTVLFSLGMYRISILPDTGCY